MFDGIFMTGCVLVVNCQIAIFVQLLIQRLQVALPYLDRSVNPPAVFESIELKSGLSWRILNLTSR